jgi:hypothetical protein
MQYWNWGQSTVIVIGNKAMCSLQCGFITLEYFFLTAVLLVYKLQSWLYMVTGNNCSLHTTSLFVTMVTALACTVNQLTSLGRSPTEATRLRFDQEKSRLHLIHGESSSHRGGAGGKSAITNWRFDQQSTVKWFFFLIESQSGRLSGRTAYSLTLNVKPQRLSKRANHPPTSVFF